MSIKSNFITKLHNKRSEAIGKKTLKELDENFHLNHFEDSMSESSNCCCSDELMLMKSTDYRLELKSVTEFVRGMNVCIDIVGSGDRSKEFVIPDMK